MFHITLITVGKLKERYYAAAADEYIRRLGAYCKFELIELPECRLPDDPNGTQIAAGLAREAEQIEAKLPRGAWFCVLTPEGTELSSEGLAERLQAEKLNGRSAACFLIGSSFGIDARIKRMADFRLSFSKMTFPHHLMRVMALEQLYRAESILAGTKYHKSGTDFRAPFAGEASICAIARREAPLALPLGELSPKVTERALQALLNGNSNQGEG